MPATISVATGSQMAAATTGTPKTAACTEGQCDWRRCLRRSNFSFSTSSGQDEAEAATLLATQATEIGSPTAVVATNVLDPLTILCVLAIMGQVYDHRYAKRT
jgi:hypothetical protein